SATSLIQTIGRAARNANGKVIMYADRMSPAMEEAIRETERRRRIQTEANERLGISPQTISKNVRSILESAKQVKQQAEAKSISMIRAEFNELIPAERKKLIQALEAQMLEYAKNLEFERAAIVRDEIEKLKA